MHPRTELPDRTPWTKPAAQVELYHISQSCSAAEGFSWHFAFIGESNRQLKVTQAPRNRIEENTKCDNRGFKPWENPNWIICVLLRRKKVLKIHLLRTLKATGAFSSWPYLTSTFSLSCSTLKSSIVIRGKTNSSSELKSCRGKLWFHSFGKTLADCYLDTDYEQHQEHQGQDWAVSSTALL